MRFLSLALALTTVACASAPARMLCGCQPPPQPDPPLMSRGSEGVVVVNTLIEGCGPELSIITREAEAAGWLKVEGERDGHCVLEVVGDAGVIGSIDETLASYFTVTDLVPLGDDAPLSPQWDGAQRQRGTAGGLPVVAWSARPHPSRPDTGILTVTWRADAL